MRGDPLKVGDRITWSEYFFDGQCYYREVLDMPQKCHGVRKYGHDLVGGRPALSRRIRRVLLHPSRHLDPQAARRAERRGGDAAQLRRRHHGIGHRSRRNHARRRGRHSGPRPARSVRRRDGEGARRALRHRSRCGGEPAGNGEEVRRRPCHQHRKGVRKGSHRRGARAVQAGRRRRRDRSLRRPGSHHRRGCRCCAPAADTCSAVWSIPAPT